MDYNIKRYQIIKAQSVLKSKSFLFFFHSAKLNSAVGLEIESALKKLKLSQYKILKATTLDIVNNTIFKRYCQLVCGIFSIVEPKFISTAYGQERLTEELKTSFVLLSLKLNNRIYSKTQVKRLKIFSYKGTALNLTQSFENKLKKIFLWTKL